MNPLNIDEKIKLKTNKNLWKKFKISDFIENINEKVNPINSDIDEYIGLEHLDSGSLHIKRFGKTKNLKGGKLKIYKGDLIFAKRRAYLKRIAIADFDAVASAHSLIFRAKKNIVSKDFLPFFLSSETFWRRAIEISVGSLSPTINWSTLAEQEFLIPPMDQQLELSKLFWSLDKVIENNLLLINKFKVYMETFMNESLKGKFHKKEDFKYYLFGELGETFGGLSGKTKKDFGEGFPFLTYMNIFENSKINPDLVELVKIKDNEKQNKIKFGDILITGSSESPDEVGMSSVVLDNLDNTYLNSFCFGFRLNSFDILLPRYARFLLRGIETRRFMMKHAQGSTRFNLSKKTLKKKLKLLIPPIDIQKKIVSNLEKNDQSIYLLNEKLKAAKLLQKSLINSIF